MNVLITGVSSGIGMKIADRYLEKGWNVIGHYHSNEGHEISNVFSSLQADFSDEKSIGAFLNEISQVHIDALINNAGTYVNQADFKELTLKEIQKTFMINTFAPMMIASAIFANMIADNFGRIVNISSIAAKYGGSVKSMPYGASKRALEGLTKTLAKEGAKYNVLVNTIRPGVIDTNFHKRFPKDMKDRINMIPVKKIGIPEDIAGVAYYLGSGENKYITNETVTIAGGE